MSTPAPTPAPQTASEPSSSRRRGLTLIAAAVALVGVSWGGWHWLHNRHHETTDNAYVAGHVVQITPLVAGTVVAVAVEDNDYVKAGQVLVKLDPADAKLALDQAEAQLAQALREVRGLYAGTAAQSSLVALRKAELERAQAEATRLQDDVSRRQGLVGSGAVGKEEFDHAKAQLVAAQSNVAAAQSALASTQQQLVASQSQTEGTTATEHPSVQRAAARVREAHVAWQRGALVAPVDGYVARRGVQVGQRVQAGAALMSVVPLSRVWVDANFKEVQLQNMRIGQKAELVADLYGQKVVYHGQISGLGVGTGAAFALLPAQNATGNWIKVVQRVPVRIELDAQEVSEHPLRVGLSMEATVNTEDPSGPVLASAPRQTAASETRVYEQQMQAAQADVQRIIDAHLRHAPASERKPS